MEGCNAGDDTTCPFTPGVGVSGVYFSLDGGTTWTQPTYQGLTARQCRTAPVGDDAGCIATGGPIATLPHYAEAGLVSDGDPTLACGPAFKNGRPAWANGARLYYANLASSQSAGPAFKGFEAIAVSSTDNVTAAAAGDASAWRAPVLASKQSATTFSGKEQIWADNAASSPGFGNVYVCYAKFRSNGPSGNHPLDVVRSTDGGATWSDRQISPATNNVHSRNGFGRSGCTERTDSEGAVSVFAHQFAFSAGGAPAGGDATDRIVMTWVDGRVLNQEKVQFSTSTDGGASWTPTSRRSCPGPPRRPMGTAAARHGAAARPRQVVFWRLGSSRASSWISLSAPSTPAASSRERSRSALSSRPSSSAQLVIHNQTSATTTPPSVP